MAVRIRMKMMGRKHRPFFRICAVDSRKARDGRVLEELGTYDPVVSETDARVQLNSERIAYWIGVGAQPSQKVKTLIKKYGDGGTHLEQQRVAREKLALPKVVPDAGQPVYIPPAPDGETAPEAPGAETPVAEAPAAETPVAETPVAETPVAETPVAETPVAETPVAETPVAEAPVAETPVAEAPAADAPAADAPPAQASETPAAESGESTGDDTASESTEKAGSVTD